MAGDEQAAGCPAAQPQAHQPQQELPEQRQHPDQTDGGAPSGGGSTQAGQPEDQAAGERVAAAEPQETKPKDQPQDQPQGEEDAAKAAAALARAEALKQEGNELFGKGMWDDAAAKYNAALDAAPRSASREQAIYFANLAACNIKTLQFAVAVQNCTEAIRLDPSYQKAYMRRCEAFERLDELDHALSDAKALLHLAPDSAWASGKVAALQPRVDERTEKLKAEAFAKLKDLGNTLLGKFGLSVDNFKFDKDPATGGYSMRFER